MNFKDYDTDQLLAMATCLRGDMRRADNLKNAVVSHDLRCAYDQIMNEVVGRNGKQIKECADEAPAH